MFVSISVHFVVAVSDSADELKWDWNVCVRVFVCVCVCVLSYHVWLA